MTQIGWRQLGAWVYHSLRFLWRGHHTLDLLQQTRANPALTSWRRFLTSLQESFIRCLLPTTSCSYTLLTNARKTGALCSCRVCVLFDPLLGFGLQHSNIILVIGWNWRPFVTLVLSFCPWIFATDVHCVMDNQATVNLNNLANLSSFLKW